MRFILLSFVIILLGMIGLHALSFVSSPLGIISTLPIKGLEAMLGSFVFDVGSITEVIRLFEYEEYDFKECYENILEFPDRLEFLSSFLQNKATALLLLDISKLSTNKALQLKIVESKRGHDLVKTHLANLPCVATPKKLTDTVKLAINSENFHVDEFFIANSTVMTLPLFLNVIKNFPADQHGNLLASFIWNKKDEKPHIHLESLRMLLAYLTISTQNSKVDSNRNVFISLIRQSLDVPADIENPKGSILSWIIDLLPPSSFESKDNLVYWMTMCSLATHFKDHISGDDALWLADSVPSDAIAPIVFLSFIRTFAKDLISSEKYHPKTDIPKEYLPHQYSFLATRKKLFLRRLGKLHTGVQFSNPDQDGSFGKSYLYLLPCVKIVTGSFHTKIIEACNQVLGEYRTEPFSFREFVIYSPDNSVFNINQDED